jgi:hypothetical protein
VEKKSKADTRGHPTSFRPWTAKSVCGTLFVDRVADEQLKLSDKGEKAIGQYRPALTTVFDGLDEDELKTCTDTAVEWNTKPLPDEIQRKYVPYPTAVGQHLIDN